MPSLFDRSTRERVLDRLRRLSAERPAQWGRMSAPQMIAHLTDQMHHALGNRPVAPLPSRLRGPIARRVAIYWLPWPKGRIQGPPEAFITQPTTWDADLARLEALVERFAARGPKGSWPEHPLFGALSGRLWGAFCFRHFDHHLSQFGV